MKQISDPVYDEYITVEDDELPLIDSSHMQRLRNISQLGLTSLVYPTATHTRFSHSLGVMNLSGKMADSLGIDTVERKAIRLAGLLHDVGHGPFSHAIEPVFEKDHEDKSCEIIEQLEDSGLLPVSAHKIIQYIRGERDPSIIASDIDADRMDYLKRDARFTGIQHGNIDTDTIIKFSKLQNDKIIFDRSAVEALEQLLVSRKNMIGSVYCHPTAQIAEQMLQEAVQDFQMETDEIWSLTDASLHTKLLESDGISNELYTRINSRNLYKTAYELRYRHLNNKSKPDLNKERIREIIFSQTDLQDHELIIQINSPSYSKMDVKVNTKDGIYSFRELSNISDLLNKPAGNELIISVYTPQNETETVNKIMRDIINIK